MGLRLFMIIILIISYLVCFCIFFCLLFLFNLIEMNERKILLIDEWMDEWIYEKIG